MIKNFSANGESGFVSDSDVNGDAELLKSDEEGLVGSPPLTSGDVGDHRSVPLVSDSSIAESAKTKFSMGKNLFSIEIKPSRKISDGIIRTDPKINDKLS